jgi:hypothetical protein
MQAQNSWKCSRSRGESHVANETAKNLLHAIPAPPPAERASGRAAAPKHDLSGNYRKKTPKKRAGDVNTPVTARNHAASATAGTHQGVTGRFTSTARLTCVGRGVSTKRESSKVSESQESHTTILHLQSACVLVLLY